MDPIAAPNPAASGGQLDLHVPGRRLDLAFAALRDIRSDSYVRCLHPMGLTVSAPAALVDSLPDVHWVVSDTHPLAFVEPSFHHRLHQGWLEAAEGPDRVGRARILTCEPIATTTDATAPTGWYEVQLVDLVGVDGFEVMVVSLVAGEPNPHSPEDATEDSSGPPGWLQNTGTFRLQLDRTGRIEGASINAAEMLSRTIPDLIGLIGTDLIHPDDRERSREAWRLVLATANRSEPSRLRVLTADDRWRWFDVTSWNRLDDPSIAAVMCEARDVDDQVHAELAREASERAHGRLAQVLDEVDDLVMVARLGYGLVYWNRAAEAAFPRFEIGTKLVDLIDPSLGGQVETEVVPAIQRLEGWKGDLTMPLADGELHVMAATISPVLDPTHDEIYFGITLREVTVERDHARALADQARRDPLTELPNRFALMELLASHRRSPSSTGTTDTTDARDEAQASQRTVTVLFVDIDNLKVVNDGMGHGAGDLLLQAVAAQLSTTARHGAVSRFGGDEFVVVYDHLEPGDALAEAERLLLAIGQVQVPGVPSQLSASIGVASATGQQIDPESLLRDADAAMYAAKRRGRGGVALFDDALREQVTRRFVLETSLRQALADGGLDVHFQPVVSVADGTIVGFEALARWGLVSPTEFVASAEESGLIVPLGQWVLEESLEALGRLEGHDPATKALRLCINVSGRQLTEPSFTKRTLETIRDRGIDPTRITLELTESVLIDPSEDVDRALRTIRDAGVSLALDDFGSGYSSLGHLRRYPIEVLKLDTSYTQALLHDTGTRIIAEAVVTMASRLGLRVVAEGVETPEQLEVVREMGINWAQGYLMSPALPMDEILRGSLGDIGRRVAATNRPPPPLNHQG